MTVRHINPEGLHRSPAFSQAVVVGDNRKYITVLIAVNADTAKKIISEAGQALPADAEVGNHPLVQERLKQKLAELNSRLGSWEQVKYFRVLPRELNEAEGELTPTLKIKRKVVGEKYRELIDSMYKS